MTCERCNGRGWVVIPDGGAGTAARCQCLDPSRNPELVRVELVRAGLQGDELESAFKKWDIRASPRPVWAVKWLEGTLARPQTSSWLLGLLGGSGRGKTMLAALLLKMYVEGGGRTGLWANAPAALDRVQRERAMEHGSAPYEGMILGAELLVLDDYRQRGRAYDEQRWDTVDSWLYHRCRTGLSTIFTTNLSSFSELDYPALESRIAAGQLHRMESAIGDYRDFSAKE